MRPIMTYVSKTLCLCGIIFRQGATPIMLSFLDRREEIVRLTIARFPLAQGLEVVPCICYVEGTGVPRGVATVDAKRVF